MGVSIRTRKDNIPEKIFFVDQIIELIYQENLISNLKKVTKDIEGGLKDIVNENDSITYTDLVNKIQSLFSAQSTAQLIYWELRGWENPSAKVSEIQRSKSRYCMEYWVNNGYSEEEASEKISTIQKEYSKISNDVGKKELRARSARCIEYWLERGYSMHDARKKRKKFNDNSSQEYYIRKHGKEKGLKLYKKACRKKGRSGKNNSMWGRPSPVGSGNSITGYYKSYYFRSLYEYFAIKHFEKNNIKFICNDVSVDEFPDKIRINYEWGGKVRKYIPDFIINDNKIIEIKNSYSVKTDKTKAKIEGATQFINSSNQYDSYEVLTEEDLKMDDNILLEDYHNGNISIDKGKLERFKNKFNL